MLTPALKTYALEGHLTVEGWLGIGALGLTIQISQRQLSRGMHAAVGEIGIHHGRFFVALALLRQAGEIATAIDVFEDQHLNVDWSGSGNRDAFLANLHRHGVSMSDVVIHKIDSLTMQSRDLISLSNGQRFRLFSIDGGHRVVNVVHDLGLVADALAPGGAIVLDDFFNPDWPGVNEGLFTFLEQNQSLAPFCYGDNKLFLCAAAEQQDWVDWVRTEIVPISHCVKPVLLSGYSVFYLAPPAAVSVLAQYG